MPKKVCKILDKILYLYRSQWGSSAFCLIDIATLPDEIRCSLVLHTSKEGGKDFDQQKKEYGCHYMEPMSREKCEEVAQGFPKDWERINPEKELDFAIKLTTPFEPKDTYRFLEWCGRQNFVVTCITEDMTDSINKALIADTPMLFLSTYKYLFGQYLWELNSNEALLDKDELRYLFLETVDKERKKFERLERKFSGQAGRVAYKREPIPEDIRIFVWRRDEGRCAKCGSDQKLEFDHIIPVSKGGANTARNIQLLCEPCNREKSDSI